MLFKNLEMFFDLTLKFSSEKFLFETQAWKCRVRM